MLGQAFRHSFFPQSLFLKLLVQPPELPSPWEDSHQSLCACRSLPTLSPPLTWQCLKPCRACILMSFVSLSSSRYSTGIVFSAIVVQNYFPDLKTNGEREVIVVNSPFCWAYSSLNGTENAAGWEVLQCGILTLTEWEFQIQLVPLLLFAKRVYSTRCERRWCVIHIWGGRLLMEGFQLLSRHWPTKCRSELF